MAEGFFGAKTIKDGTVTEQKLSLDVQQKLNNKGSAIYTSNVLDDKPRIGYTAIGDTVKEQLDGISDFLNYMRSLILDCSCTAQGTLSVVPNLQNFDCVNPTYELMVTGTSLTNDIVITNNFDSNFEGTVTPVTGQWNVREGGRVAVKLTWFGEGAASRTITFTSGSIVATATITAGGSWILSTSLDSSPVDFGDAPLNDTVSVPFTVSAANLPGKLNLYTEGTGFSVELAEGFDYCLGGNAILKFTPTSETTYTGKLHVDISNADRPSYVFPNAYTINLIGRGDDVTPRIDVSPASQSWSSTDAYVTKVFNVVGDNLTSDMQLEFGNPNWTQRWEQSYADGWNSRTGGQLQFKLINTDNFGLSSEVVVKSVTDNTSTSSIITSNGGNKFAATAGGGLQNSPITITGIVGQTTRTTNGYSWGIRTSNWLQPYSALGDLSMHIWNNNNYPNPNLVIIPNSSQGWTADDTATTTGWKRTVAYTSNNSLEFAFSPQEEGTFRYSGQFFFVDPNDNTNRFLYAPDIICYATVDTPATIVNPPLSALPETTTLEPTGEWIVTTKFTGVKTPIQIVNVHGLPYNLASSWDPITGGAIYIRSDSSSSSITVQLDIQITESDSAIITITKL